MPTDDLDRVLADIDDLLPPGAPSASYDPSMPDAMSWSPVDHDDHPDTAPPDRYVRRYLDGPAEYPAPRPVPPAALGRLRSTPPTARPGWLRDALNNLAHGSPYRSPAERIARAAADVDRFATIPIPAQFAHGGTWSRLQSTVRELTVTGTISSTDALDTILGILTGAAQHNRHECNTPDTRAAALIEARRNRNTGPSNPQGIDGRARRHQRPRRAPAPHARPGRPGATQERATPPRALVVARGGTLVLLSPDGRPLEDLARYESVIAGFDPAAGFGADLVVGGVLRGQAADAVTVDEEGAGDLQRDTTYDGAGGPSQAAGEA